MANKFQVKRTTITGRTPNTTSSGNTHFIDTGELALNLTDGKMFSSNGSAYFEVGANLENIRVNTSANLNQVQLANVVVSNTVTIENDKELAFKAVSGNKTRLVLQSDDNFVMYSTNTSGGARVVYAIYANSTTSNLQIHVPLQPLSGIIANGSIGSAGQTLTSNGSSIYWAAGAGTGTVTQVNTGNGLTGGPITATGTIDVVANNGIVANSTGVFANPGTGVVVNATGIHVNSSYVQNTDSRTLSGNIVISGTYFNPSSNTILLGNSTQRWVVSANSVDSNQFTSGTINATSSGVVVNSDIITIGKSTGSNLQIGTAFISSLSSVRPESNTVGTALGTTTARWVITANSITTSGSGSIGTTLAAGNTTITGFTNVTSTIQGGSSLTIAGALSGVTTAAMGNTTVTGFVNATSSIQGGGSLTIAGAASGITTLAAGNTTITGFANVTSTIQGGSSLTIAGALSGVTTAAMGNTTITGFANASVSVNSALLTVGTSFIANTTGAYHTGTVNADSHTTTGIVANTSGVYPTSNTVGTALGTTTNRWTLAANAASFTGQVEVRDTWDTATGNGAIYLDGATGNRIDWNVNGIAAPAVTTRSAGTKLVLYPGVGAAAVDYGIGVETNHLWLSASDTTSGIKFYANTTQLAVANTSGVTIGSGGIFPTSNSTATSLGSSTQRWVLNANTGSFAGAVSGITTLAAGNTTITGFANVSTSVNSALLTVGTSFIANTTGAYHTGLVNAASINIGGSGFIANSTAIVLAKPVTANGTTGTSGQLLTSNGTTGSPYWSTVSSGSTVTLTDDTATNGTRYLAFANQTSGTLTNIYTDSTGLTYNPSTGTVSAAVFSATSDERLKTNINIIEEPLEKIQKIRGVTFNYKANDNPGVGVIAQDIDQIFPELVSINSEGYKSVVYDGLIGLLIESIKDQQKQIDILSSVVDQLLHKKV